MKKLILFLAVAVLVTSSCSNRSEGAVNGAAVGSLLGSVLGNIVGGYHGDNVGTLVGTVAGGAVGYSVGSASERRREARSNYYAPQGIMVRETLVEEQPVSYPTQTIAHRGFWRAEGAAQNSKASLKKALDLGIWGSEIDVWMTTDNHVMVNHDETFQGITVQDTTFAACRKLRLSNGEKMPELKDLLKVMRKTSSPTCLVLEVKRHRDPQRSRDCAVASVEAVKKAGVLDRTVYISFSMEACETIHQLLPSASVAYLSGDLSPEEVHKKGINGIDYHINVFRQHPEWVEEAHRLRMSVNVWTVDKPLDIIEMHNLGVDFITTNEPTRCDSILTRTIR